MDTRSVGRTLVILAAIALTAALIVSFRRRSRADDPITVTVEADCPGLTAAQVEQSIADPIEQQVNGVEHLRRLRSRCGGDGSYLLEASFTPGIDRDLAQRLVQNRVVLAMPVLPTLVPQLGLIVRKGTSGLLVIVVLHSPDGRYDASDLARYATVHFRDALGRCADVGVVNVLGARDNVMRIWLDRDKLAFRNLTIDDVRRALEQQNLALASDLGTGSGDLLIVPQRDRVEPMQPEELVAIAIKTDAEGHSVRLRDVGRVVEIRAQQAAFASLDGRPAAALAVYALAGAQPVEVNASVRASLEDLRSRLPDGVEASIAFDLSPEAMANGPGYLVLDCDPPIGSSPEQIAGLMARLERSLRPLAGVRNVLALPEQPLDRDRGQACLMVSIGSADGAAIDRDRLVREVRERVLAPEHEAAPRLRVLSGDARSRRFGYPIEFAIVGPDRSWLQQLAAHLADRMSQDPRLADVWAGRLPEPAQLERVNLMPAVTITASPAAGATVAEARIACERMAAEVLARQQPAEYRLVWP